MCSPMPRKSSAVTMRNAILRNHLRWPETVFAWALANAIHRARNNSNNIHGFDREKVNETQVSKTVGPP